MEIVLNRIIIFCDDINTLKTFYQQHFKFSLVEEIKEEWVVLKAGDTEIAFHKIGVAYKSIATPFRAESNTKLVFEISDNLASFRETLLAKGVSLNELKSFDGLDFIHCDGEDPEGNVFQLRQRITK